MTPGPKPKPTELKKAEGNPGKRPLNQNEPTPPEMPALMAQTPPKHLTDVGQTKWLELAKLLGSQRILTVMDAESRYALRRLYSLLDRLSTRERLVLVLRHIEGMTLEEIAEAMELSLATVKRGLRRATLRVSQMVDSDDPKRRASGTALKRR